MATYTSTQAGLWSAQATWGGSGPPANGDVAVLNHTVTVAASATVGTSPDDLTTDAITINNAGKLVVSTGVTLTVRGRLNNDAGSAGLGRQYGLRVEGSGIVEMDGSVVGAARIYYIYCGQYGRIQLVGTDANNRATLRSNTGGSFAQFKSELSSQGNLTSSSWGLVQRFGDATNKATLNNSSAVSGESISITDTVFRNCGAIYISSTNANNTITLQRIQTESSAATIVFYITGKAGATLLCEECTFDNAVYITLSETWIYRYNYSAEVYNSPASVGFGAGSGNNFIRLKAVNGTAIYGGISTAYYMHDQADGANYFYTVATATGADQSWEHLIFDFGDTSPQYPDGIKPVVDDVAYSINIKNNLFLPDSAGVSSGAWINFFSSTMAGTVAIEHNTAISCSNIGQSAIYVGESNYGYAGMITSLKSNLIYTPTGKTAGYIALRDGDSTVQDYVAATNVDYNWRWNLAAGSDGNGFHCLDTGTTFFSSGTPNVHGGTGDPEFVDASRNCARAYTDCFSQSAGSAWSAAHGTYTEGDIVSNSSASRWDGDTIAYRCVATHDSSTANSEPGAGSSFRTYWELATYYHLRQDPTRIATMITWVRNGFKVRNSSLRNAGHDGVTIGAEDYQASGGGSRMTLLGVG